MFHQLEEIEARELRSTAYHEAAHKVICERFGGLASASVWRNESNNPAESAWLGACQMYAPEAENIRRKAFGVRQVRVPLRADEYIAMAGMTAECVLADLAAPEQYAIEADANWFLEESLRTMIEQGEASESDLHHMGISVGEDGEIVGWRGGLIKTGIRMVREEWIKIAAEAERLIAEASDTVSAAA